MRNNFIKTLSLFMSCLTLSLLLNVVTQKNNLKVAKSTVVHTDELSPWI